jgi:hypothetical protein
MREVRERVVQWSISLRLVTPGHGATYIVARHAIRCANFTHARQRTRYDRVAANYAQQGPPVTRYLSKQTGLCIKLVLSPRKHVQSIMM